MITTEKELSKKIRDVLPRLSDEYKKTLGVGPEYGTLKPGQTVIFKILRQPLKVRNIENDQMDILPASTRIPNTDSIYDGKDMFEITCSDGTQDTELLFIRESYAQIVFTPAEPQRYPLMWFLRMSNFNASNPYAINTYVKTFEEVATEANEFSSVAKEADIAKLTLYISEKVEADLIQICRQLGLNADQNANSLKTTLMTFVKNDRNRDKFKSLVMDGDGAVIELVKKAVSYGLISYDDDIRTWKNLISGKEINDILQVSIGEEQHEALAKFLLSSDKKGKNLKLFLEAKNQEVLIQRRTEQLGKII